MKRFLILIVLASIVVAGFGFVWLRFTAPKPGELATLQDGDLLFQTIKSSQTAAIIAATGSPYTHVGIAKHDPKLGLVVVEATGPVRETPLEQWIKQGIGARVTVKRLHSMTPTLAAKILDAAKVYYGKPYDFLFRFDKDAIYCSELVYDAFQEGGKITVGHIQQVMELNTDNLAVQKLLSLRWHDHPLCQTPPNNTVITCTDLIMRQELITPASIAADGKFDTVYDNYHPLAR